MSSVVIAGNTSGSVTLDAPAVAGSTTLTLPTTSGTIVATSNGFAGMTLLGTIVPTVANSISLSSLTLTSYKSLYIVINNVAITSSKQCFISSTNIQTGGGWGTISSNVPVTGTLLLDLGTGALGGSTSEATYNSTTSISAGGLSSSVSTATTTLYFRVSSTNNFVAGGSIVIYGVA